MLSFTHCSVLKFLIVIFFLFFSKTIYSQSVTIYIVDRDDFELKNIETRVVSQEEAETEYHTLVLVYDSFRKEIIGGWGSYQTKRPTNNEFKEIIDNAVMDLYNDTKQIRCTEINPKNAKYDGILGLRWGMSITDALLHLDTMSLSNVHQSDNERLTILNTVYWNSVKFNFIQLGYFVSNKQKLYLSDIDFVRLCEESQEAKNIRDSISFSLCQDFGKENVSEAIDEDGFKRYTVFQEVRDGVKMSRIYLYIVKLDKTYAVCLSYKGWVEATEVVLNENSN